MLSLKLMPGENSPRDWWIGTARKNAPPLRMGVSLSELRLALIVFVC
jgi:hypothetical protein